MANDLFDNLKLYETDVDGALYRLLGNEDLYLEMIDSFRNDNTIYVLKDALASKSWDDAFTAAHALKGLAGNLGFVPLLHLTGELVVSIRKGEISELDGIFKNLFKNYNDIMKIIGKSEDEGTKE